MAETGSTKGIALKWLLSLAAVLVLGIALGVAFVRGNLGTPVQLNLVSVGIGLVWAYLLLQLIDLLGQMLSFLSDPIPAQLDVNNSTELGRQIDSLKDRPVFIARVKRLLLSVERGGSESVYALAAFQSQQARKSVQAGALFSLILLGACMWQNAEAGVLVFAGFVLLAVVVYAKLTLLAQMDLYIESNLLSHLKSGAGAAFPVEKMGQAIDEAFGKYIPQPEKMAAAITGAIDGASKSIAAQTADAQKSIASAQASLGDKMSEISGAISQQLGQVGEVLGGLAKNLNDGYGSGVAGLTKALEAHASQVTAAGEAWKGDFGQVADAHAAKLKEWNGDFGQVVDAHASKLQEANKSIAIQLEKIAALEADVSKVLHLQDAVDGALKSVTGTEEFSGLMKTLRTYLEETRGAVQELSKPRTITLVEADSDS